MSIATQPRTIEDIARLAGVSRKTVSRYLNNSPLLADTTRQKVARIISETGFAASSQARGLALGRNYLIALIHDGTDPGVCGIVEAALLNVLAGGEYALVLHAVPGALPPDEKALLTRAFLARHRPAGMIVLPPLSQDVDILQLCHGTGTACVRLGHVREDHVRENYVRDENGRHDRAHHSSLRSEEASSAVPYNNHALAANDRIAMAGLIAWLIGQGHQRIALLSGPESSLTAQQRELGYLDAMADHGLDRGPALVATGDLTFNSGMEAGQLLLQVSPRPTAIVACNDEMAAGVIHAAAAAGIAVPDRLSVTGFDDTPLAERLVPALTSVHVPWADMAKEAARRIIDRPASIPLCGSATGGAIDQPSFCQLTLDASLSVRQSVSARAVYAAPALSPTLPFSPVQSG